MMRKAENGDGSLIHFRYDKDLGYHIQTEYEDKETTRAIRERGRLKEIAKAVFAPPKSFCHTEAVNAIMDHTSKGMSTAKTMLGNMVGFAFVEKGTDNNYRLKLATVNLGQ